MNKLLLSILLFGLVFAQDPPPDSSGAPKPDSSGPPPDSSGAPPDTSGDVVPDSSKDGGGMDVGSTMASDCSDGEYVIDLDTCTFSYCKCAQFESSSNTNCVRYEWITKSNIADMPADYLRDQCGCTTPREDWTFMNDCSCPTCEKSTEEPTGTDYTDPKETDYTDPKETRDMSDDPFDDTEGEKGETVDETETYYLKASATLKVSQIWDSRSEIWYVLKSGLRKLLAALGEDTDETKMRIYVSRCLISEDTSSDDGGDDTTHSGTDDSDHEPTSTFLVSGGRRLLSLRSMLQDPPMGGSDMMPPESTMMVEHDDWNKGFLISVDLAVYEDSEDNIISLFQTLYELGESFGTDYSADCKTESETTDVTTGGFLTVEAQSASLAYYNGDALVASVTYQDGAVTTEGDVDTLVDGTDGSETTREPGHTGSANMMNSLYSLTFVVLSAIYAMMY